MSLEIRVDDANPQRVVVEPVGRLDAMSATAFDRRIAEVIAPMPDHATLVLDLVELKYVSSGGLRSLFRTRKLMKAKNGHSLLVHAQPQVKKVFDIVKAVPINEIFASVAELDAYLDKMQRKVVQGEDED